MAWRLAHYPGSHFFRPCLALIFGLFASTLFTLVVVPVSYYAVYGQKLAAASDNSGSET
ncbi:MAG: hypothetical protein R2861_03300 [Desulfobacterales bacterium]